MPVVSWSIYQTHWGSLMIIKKFSIWTLYSKPEVTQITISKISHNCPVHAAENQTGKLWISYHQQCPSPQALHFCRIHWQLGVSSVFHKPNDSLFHAAVILFMQNLPIFICTKWHISKNLCSIYHMRNLLRKGYFTIRKTDNFWGGNFLVQAIEWKLMCLPLKLIWRNDIWLGHH